jgi:hypothetical protein
MTMDPAIRTTIETRRAEIEARKLGIDARPGKRVTLRVVSIPTNQVVCGRMLSSGENILADVLESDVAEFLGLVEDATPEELAIVERELKLRVADATRLRSQGKKPDAYSTTWVGAFTGVLRREPKALRSVEILTDEAPSAPSKKGSRS